jgi:hypothetical protein
MVLNTIVDIEFRKHIFNRNLTSNVHENQYVL